MTSKASAPKAPLESIPEIERLKAENASLLESLRAGKKQEAELIDELTELNETASATLAAAEQRAEAAEKELALWREAARRSEQDLDEARDAANKNAAEAFRAWKERDALRVALREALGTMQGPMAEMEKRCVLDRPHDHGHLRALRAAMQILQDAHDRALLEEAGK